MTHVSQPGYYEVPRPIKYIVAALDVILLGVIFGLLNFVGDFAQEFLLSGLNIPEESIWKDSEFTIRLTIELAVSLLVLAGTFYAVVAVNRLVLRRWYRPAPMVGD